MKLIAAVLLLGPLALAQFYVKDQQYRFRKGDPRCDVNHFCDFEQRVTPDDHNFSINFVEFKGDGTPFDPQQLENALAQIETALYKDPKTGKPWQKPLLFVYIHGWHNNADELENKATRICPDLKGDVAKFRDCGLAAVAGKYVTLPNAPPSVVGIYLAWQGLDFTPLGIVTYIVPSYPLRRYAATHIGMTGMCDALGKILDKAEPYRKDYTIALVGQSFGARVLENADETLSDGCTGAMKRHRDLAMRGTQERPPADLVFYVNAAASNTITRRTIKYWNSHCDVRKQDNPICSANPFYLAEVRHERG
jgi:hypothetical protein